MKKNVLVLSAGCFFSISLLRAQVVINEFSAANYDAFTDNYGQYEDWVELYNTGASSVDLSGYHLSDDMGDPEKWAFPSGTTISAGGFLRAWCSGRDVSTGTNYHTNFKISQTKTSEDIVFSDPAGTIIDNNTIDIPNQKDHSWGRYPNGGSDWYIFTSPSPNASNTGVHYTAYAPKPNMDPNSGNYAGSVTITITADPGITIRYTTDGSYPTAASTLYTGPITLTTTHVMRVVGFSASTDTLPSFCSTNTYFIDETSTLPVVSIAGDEVDDLLLGNGWIHPVGTFELFDSTFNLVDEGMGEYNEHGNDSWFYAQRGVDYITRDQFGYDCDIHQHYFSDVNDRTHYQRLILKAAANDNYPFETGGAHVRDAYVHHLSQVGKLDLDERSVHFVILFMNGQYWGVYDMREKVDDQDYTKYYYNQDEYDIDFIQCWGGTWAAYGTMAAWNPFVNFVTTNDMTDPANYAYVTDNLDVQSLIDYVLVGTETVCKDWLNWNTAWWRGYNPDGGAQQWRYCLWDDDATFGHYINYTGIPDITATANPCDPLSLGWVDPNGHIDIVNALMDNDDFHSLYINRFADLINTTFSCDYMIPVLDSMRDAITPEMPRQITRWGGSLTTWNNNFDALENFINDRCDYIVEGISDCFDVDPYDIVVQIEPAGTANAVKVNTVIPASFPYAATYFSGTTMSFDAIAAAGYTFDHWDFLHHTPSPDAYNDTVTVSLTHTDTITAWFQAATLPEYNFSVDVVPAGAGDVTVNTFTPAAYPYSTTYTSGSLVDMDAAPAAGYVFDYWELENHIANPSPFDADVYFDMSTFENAIAHFKAANAVNNADGFTFNLAINPNVTSGTVNVDYTLSQAAEGITFELYSITGRKIADLGGSGISDAPGEHSFPLDLSAYHLASGVYFVKMNAGSSTKAQRVILQ